MHRGPLLGIRPSNRSGLDAASEGAAVAKMIAVCLAFVHHALSGRSSGSGGRRLVATCQAARARYRVGHR